MPFTPSTNYASKANTGYEATLSIGSPLAEMLELKSIEITPLDVPDVEIGHLKSPNNTEEYTPGTIKTGVIDLMGNFIGDASQTQILTLAEALTPFPFQVKSSMQQGAKTYTGTGVGHFKNYKVGTFERNKPVEFRAQIKIDTTYVEDVA